MAQNFQKMDTLFYIQKQISFYNIDLDITNCLKFSSYIMVYRGLQVGCQVANSK